MSAEKDKAKGISTKRMLSNNFFLLRFMFRGTPVYAISIMIEAVRHNLVNFLEQTVCVYLILDVIETRKPYQNVLWVVGLFLALDFAAAAISNLYEQRIKLKYLPPFSETSPIFCSFPFTKIQPVFLPEQTGRKKHRTPFPPSATPAGITHYTLLRKVVCQMGALPPLETPTRKGGTLPLHGAHTAFSCYPALRLYRLSKSQHGIGVVSLIM